ncbi:hypothetical protein KDA82_37490, partial [Streptomyces daliensis]|nr:hypothetical protein [Streptomyces daliensis]
WDAGEAASSVRGTARTPGDAALRDAYHRLDVARTAAAELYEGATGTGEVPKRRADMAPATRPVPTPRP